MLRDIRSTNTLCDSILISWNIIIGGKEYEILFKIAMQNKKAV